MADQKEPGALLAGIRSRPKLPKEYGLPADDAGLLSWEWVVERLEKAKNYWVCTTRPDGRPHSTPVWAIWSNGTLYFDGHPRTRWARNIAHNPTISIHLESGDEVVILEGNVEDISTLEQGLAEQLAAISNSKYSYSTAVDEMVSRGLFAFHPHIVLAWSEFPKTMTRWQFER